MDKGREKVLVDLLRECGEAGQSLLVAVDKYNEKHGTHIVGAPLLKIAKLIAKIATTLDGKQPEQEGD